MMMIIKMMMMMMMMMTIKLATPRLAQVKLIPAMMT
jgi:hypothetical protein